MTNYIMTRLELQELLESDRYQIRDYPKVNFMEFERVNGWGKDVFTIFDDLTEQLGRIPNQSEFVEAGTLRYKKLFYSDNHDGKRLFHYYDHKNKRTVNVLLTWSDRLVTAVQNRLDRSYRSNLIEHATLTQIRDMFPSYKIFTHHYMDIVMGVDIAVMTPEGKLFYIHITSNTKWAIEAITQKGKSRPYILANGKRHYWQRNFDSSHTIFAYDKTRSDVSDIINGNILFNSKYVYDKVNEIVDSGLADEAGNNSQLFRFFNYLVNTGEVSKEGLKETLV